MSTRRSSRTNPRTAVVNPTTLPTEVLRLRLQQANLATTGRRPQLVKRLANHLRTTTRQPPAAEDPQPPQQDTDTEPALDSEEQDADQDTQSESSASTSDATLPALGVAHDHPPRPRGRQRHRNRSESSSSASSHSERSPSSDTASTMSDSDRAWRRSRHYRQRSRRRRSRSPYRSHRSPRTWGRSPSGRYHRYRSRSRSRSPFTARSSRSSHRSVRQYSPSRNHHRSTHHHRLSTHSSRQHHPRRHHRRHSVLDRLGPTPSPSPSPSDTSESSDEIPPSSCGQPIRPSLLRRIRRGEYVDLAHLLPSPPGLDSDRRRRSRWSRSPSPSRPNPSNHTREHQGSCPKITNIELWLRAWSRYLLAVSHYYPAKALQMIKYQDHIITAAERYSVDGWYSYDKAFRLKLSHDPSLRWDRLDGNLWAFWCAAQARPYCTRCHRYGHLQAACPATAKPFRPPKTKDGRIICLRFNHNNCTNPNKCHYTHVCVKCEGNHPSTSCTSERGT